MFEHPPAWTEPIRNLSSWFDWGAIGAIGTMAAVWVALWQTSRNDRHEAREGLRALGSYRTLVGEVSMALVDLPKQLDARGPHAFDDISYLRDLPLMQEEIERFTLQDFPSAQAWRHHLEVRRNIAALTRIFAAMKAAWPERQGHYKELRFVAKELNDLHLAFAYDVLAAERRLDPLIRLKEPGRALWGVFRYRILRRKHPFSD